MNELTAAVRELLDALAATRSQYVPTARSSPDPREVAHRRRQRLERAEQTVRDLIEDDEPTAVDRAAGLLVEARALCDEVTSGADDAFDMDGLVSLWRDSKEAANRLYQTCKTVEPHIIASDPNSRGWHNGGRPVEVRRRFEVELLNHEQFTQWLASQDDNAAEVEWAPKLNKDARDLVRRALVDNGEKADGVSAGYSNPFLALGRGA